MLLKKTLKYFCFLFLFLTNASFANEKILLDNHLINQQYDQFEQLISKNIGVNKIEYLQSYSYSGHPIIYWLLASYSAQNVLSKKFLVKDKLTLQYIRRNFYIALILTKQDSYSCLDIDSRRANSYYLNSYNNLLDFERRYTDDRKEDMLWSIDFVKKLKNRPDPKWSCLLFGNKNTDLYGRTYNAVSIFDLRNSILNDFLLKYK